MILNHSPTNKRRNERSEGTTVVVVSLLCRCVVVSSLCRCCVVVVSLLCRCCVVVSLGRSRKASQRHRIEVAFVFATANQYCERTKARSGGRKRREEAEESSEGRKRRKEAEEGNGGKQRRTEAEDGSGGRKRRKEAEEGHELRSGRAGEACCSDTVSDMYTPFPPSAERQTKKNTFLAGSLLPLPTSRALITQSQSACT